MEKKPNVNQLLLYFMVKQMFEAAHSNTPFNSIVEKTKNENNVKEDKQIRGRHHKPVRDPLRHSCK